MGFITTKYKGGGVSESSINKELIAKERRRMLIENSNELIYYIRYFLVKLGFYDLLSRSKRKGKIIIEGIRGKKQASHIKNQI